MVVFSHLLPSKHQTVVKGCLHSEAWESLPPMHERRDRAAVATVADRLYVPWVTERKTVENGGGGVEER